MTVLNITEKYYQLKQKEVTPGEIIEIPVDLAMSHDGTSPPAIKTFEKVATKVWDNEKLQLYLTIMFLQIQSDLQNSRKYAETS